jgi:hypothetical protein
MKTIFKNLFDLIIIVMISLIKILQLTILFIVMSSIISLVCLTFAGLMWIITDLL